MFSSTPFHIVHQGLDERVVQETLTRVYTALAPELAKVLVPMGVDRSSVVRIGVISSHFFDHSVGRMMVELLAVLRRHALQSTCHDALCRRDLAAAATPTADMYLHQRSGHREPLTYELFVVYLDGRGIRDSVTETLERVYGDHFLHVVVEDQGFGSERIPALRDTIAKLSFDIILYPDIGMDYRTYLLSYSRLAPLQVCFVRCVCVSKAV